MAIKGETKRLHPVREEQASGEETGLIGGLVGGLVDSLVSGLVSGLVGGQSALELEPLKRKSKLD